MGHIDYNRKTRAEATPSEWLSIGAQVGQMANIWSDRNDLVGYVGPGAGGQAPACFCPATAEIEVNVDKAFGAGMLPADVGDLRERANQFEWPRAVGAIFHEALHARYSRWDIPRAADALSPAEFRALILLEEGRIEYNGVNMFPENAGFLRSSALELVLSDFTEEIANESDTVVAAQVAALSLARVDAGVLEETDIEAIAKFVDAKLGTDTLNKLRDIWLSAQAHDVHHDATAMYELAREWVKVVDAQAEENGDQPSGGADGGEGMSEFIKDLIEAIEGSAEEAAIGAYGQLDDQQTSEEWRNEAKSRTEAAKEEAEHKQEASDVFGKGTGPMADNPTRSKLNETRPPSTEERAAAVQIGNMLDKAKYRDRDEVEVNTILPPGRLRTRAMVQGAALKSKGIMTQVEPWRRTKRMHTDEPTLNIGVMVDISGSMGGAMEPMAVTAWVMSEAARRVQARAAMVYYGEGVFPTLKPGQHLDAVNVYSAPDGTEKFDKAFKALNGALDLLNGPGARLLVVVSDGCYTSVEARAASRWMARCTQAGVGVLWLSIDHGHDAKRITNGSSAVLLPNTTNPVMVASEIGRAAARALSVAV
jgi:hypothetical protein